MRVGLFSSGQTLDIDETLPPGDSVTWVFDVFDGTASEALAVANALNISPRVEITAVGD